MTLATLAVPQVVRADECSWYDPSTWGDCIVNWANKKFLEIIGTFIKYAALGLEWAIGPSVQGSVLTFPVVREAWEIVRNFMNMFFILFLIIMAFATIFDIQRYSWRNVLPHFIIAALLLNFSFAISKYVIEVGNGLAQVLLQSIGNLADQLGQGFALGTLIPPTSGSWGTKFLAQITDTFLNKAGGTLINLIGGGIFLIIVLLALLVAFIFVILRIPILWFLLILSPIAFVSYVLPSTQSFWKKWWNYIISWTFFLPIYLFFLMFAVMFIANKGRASIPPLPGTISNLFVGPGSALDTFLFYAVTFIFLIFGLRYSFKVGSIAANGAGAIMGKIEAGVRKYAPGAAYVRGAVAGLKERGAEIAEKGVTVPFTGGYRLGGAARAREQEARARGWFAPGPTTGEREARKQEAAEIDKEVKRLRELNLTLDQLNERIKTTKGLDNIAAMKLKAENGWLETTDKQKIIDIIRGLGGTNTVSGASFVASLQRGDFNRLFAGPEDKKQFLRSKDLETPELLGLKKALLMDAASGGELFDEDLIAATTELHRTDSKEIQDKAREAVKKSLSNLALGKTTKEKEAILDRLEKLDGELARSFAMSMAEDKEVLEESMVTRILDMYKDQSAEAKAKIEKALRENIQNFAKRKEDRKALLLDQRRDASGNIIKTDPRIKKMIADLMIEKKEVNDLKSREEILDLIGRGTAAEREASRRINSINPLLNVEEKVRKEMGITSLDSELPEEGKERVLNELVAELDKISKEEFGKLKQMSADFYRDPRFRQAIQMVLTKPDEMAQLFKDAPRDLKNAIRDLPGAVREQRQRQSKQTAAAEEGPRIQPSTTFEKSAATPEEQADLESEREKAREYLRQQGKF